VDDLPTRPTQARMQKLIAQNPAAAAPANDPHRNARGDRRDQGRARSLVHSAPILNLLRSKNGLDNGDHFQCLRSTIAVFDK
jgi:hypothetical protein